MHEASTFFPPLSLSRLHLLLFSSTPRRQSAQKKKKLIFRVAAKRLRLSYDVDDLLLRGFHLEWFITRGRIVPGSILILCLVCSRIIQFIWSLMILILSIFFNLKTVGRTGWKEDFRMNYTWITAFSSLLLLLCSDVTREIWNCILILFRVSSFLCSIKCIKDEDKSRFTIDFSSAFSSNFALLCNDKLNVMSLREKLSN